MVQPAPFVKAAMAMAPKTENRPSSQKRRIRQFYALLSRRDFNRCHRIIDPRIRSKASSVTLFQYGNAFRPFVDHFGSVTVLAISPNVHLDDPSALHGRRAFAVCKPTST